MRDKNQGSNSSAPRGVMRTWEGIHEKYTDPFLKKNQTLLITQRPKVEKNKY